MRASNEPADGLDEPVEIIAWSPGWAALARALIAELTGALGPGGRIEHIGSTALEGMAAKPVVDLMIGVDDVAEQQALAHRLSAARWQDMGEAGVPGRRHLRRRSPAPANLHIVLLASPHWANNLAIRDYLSRHAEERAAYAALKQSLAASGVNRLLAYSERKAPFMTALLARATAWRIAERDGG